MKSPLLNIQIIKSVVFNSYSSSDIREFIQICYDLAMPLVRKKIFLGKINLNILGMSENDLLYDCLADLFERDGSGRFPQIGEYFNREIDDIKTSNETEILLTLRRLVFGKINQNFIRIYSEADPVLSKILRNIKQAVDTHKLFDFQIKFGETYLIPQGCDLLHECPPITDEYLKDQILKNVLIRDNIPKILRTVYDIVVTQKEYQRCIPLISIALIIKSIYSLGKLDDEKTEYVDMDVVHLDIENISNSVCAELLHELYDSYVAKKKCCDDIFGKYISATKEILRQTYGDGKGESFYEILKQQIPKLTKTEYAEKHRTTLEYFVRLGKKKMKEKFNE
ncbi:MAG: hypothetical protein Q8K98_03695 [Bacteroidota bacterium]|nr:hypothetical protein [Bacteroidota bacterium]